MTAYGDMNIQIRFKVLLSDSKQLPEPMLTNHQEFVALIHSSAQYINPQMSMQIKPLKLKPHIPVVDTSK